MGNGYEAYEFRQIYRCSWHLVAEKVGYCNSQSARKAARRYADTSSLPWPLNKASKGAGIYKSRLYGFTWMQISREYGQPIKAVQRCAYKWAKRYDKSWPPR
tara:strand:+ start:223 stop:528 length:306 start_codon:yes stop_codon:yes gene_type:complete